MILTGWLARAVGIFAAGNLAVLLGNVLSAISFYIACRLLRGSWLWSFAGALVFALCRYGFSQSEHHLTVFYYWHIPLCLVVCQWLMRGEGINLGERRFSFAVVVAAVTGVQHIYYTYLFVQLVALGGLYQAMRRGWRSGFPAALIIMTSLGAGLLINLNTILYHLVNGGNDGAVVRDYHWLEVYGLKLVDLVVPPPDHPFPPFAAWGANHLSEVLLAAGETPPSGYLGLIGLSALGWLVAASWRRSAARLVMPLEAFLILWIILFATVGGINGIAGALGLYLFRTTTRYSLFILCIVLMYAVRRLSEMPFKRRFVSYGLAILAVVLAYWDQPPPRVTDQDLAEIAAQVASDRDFTAKMEQRLPAGAMVFQLPIMDFPESPVSGLSSSDHFRPYLYSHSLRFSFGTDKGRPELDWQQQVRSLSTEQLVAQLEGAGFAAIYVNRNGFDNQGADLVKIFQQMGRTEIIESQRGDLLCVVLKKP